MTISLTRVSALVSLCLPLAAQVDFTASPDRIEIAIDGKPFSAFFLGAKTLRPYLHPLRSASGKIVTRRFPMEEVPGEQTDHPHHRGLWLAHGDVNGEDFWLDEGGKIPRKSRVALAGAPSFKGGKNSGSLQATFHWLTPQGKPLLVESRTIVFYSDPALRIIDVDAKLMARERVTFGDTKEGTFAIRVATALEEPSEKRPEPKRTGRIINAEGLEGEKNVWGKRSPWVDYSGELDGEKLGIAVMDHPSNPKHPTYWHARGYGLFAANIFAEHDFFRDKSRNGSVTVEQGKSIRFRYRVVIHSGDHKTANIAAMYEKYASLK